MHFIWPILCNSANTRFLFLLMCVICAKGNEVVANSCYTNICFTINVPLRMLPRHFWYFHCFNFKFDFRQKIYAKNCHFLTSSKFRLCRKTLRSGNRWQENSGPLNNYRNLQKNIFLFA